MVHRGVEAWKVIPWETVGETNSPKNAHEDTFRIMVHRGVEPRFSPCKGDVLAVGQMDRGK